LAAAALADAAVLGLAAAELEPAPDAAALLGAGLAAVDGLAWPPPQAARVNDRATPANQWAEIRCTMRIVRHGTGLVE